MKTLWFAGLFIGLFIFPSCYRNLEGKMKKDTSEARSENTSTMSEIRTNDLCNEVVSIGYNALFRYPENEAVLDSLWDNQNDNDSLIELVNNKYSGNECKFLTSEILFKKNMDFLYRMENNVLSKIYLKAAIENYSSQMSDWGFKRGPNDLGLLGRRMIIFGEASINSWKPYLTDDTKIAYNFMDEMGEDPGYRLKDLAALYIINIKELPISLGNSIDERDEAIMKVIEQLK